MYVICSSCTTDNEICEYFLNFVISIIMYPIKFLKPFSYTLNDSTVCYRVLFILSVFIHTMYALMTNIPWLYTVHTINPYQKHSFACNKGAHMCYILRGYRTSIIRIYGIQ